MIENHGDPELIYLRRAHREAPVELMIVEGGVTKTYVVRDDRLLRIIADGADYLASRPGKP